MGVAVRDKETGVIWVYMGSNELEAILVNIPSRPFGSRFIELANIELAPASEQLWIAVQDSMSTVDLINGLGKAGLICELHLLRYRIKRLADGYCYPEQKGGC